MSSLSYEDSKKIVLKIIIVLAVITVLEVAVALVGKGYIGGMEWHPAIMGLLMIGLSLTKAYFIIYEFMHMKYEVPGLVKSVLLPTALLIWAVIAFGCEGDYWNKSRAKLKNASKEEVGLQLDSNSTETEDIYRELSVG